MALRAAMAPPLRHSLPCATPPRQQPHSCRQLLLSTPCEAGAARLAHRQHHRHLAAAASATAGSGHQRLPDCMPAGRAAAAAGVTGAAANVPSCSRSRLVRSAAPPLLLLRLLGRGWGWGCAAGCGGGFAAAGGSVSTAAGAAAAAAAATATTAAPRLASAAAPPISSPFSSVAGPGPRSRTVAAAMSSDAAAAGGGAASSSSSASPTGAIVVYVTVPSAEVGEALASKLVESKLAACVNMLPGVTSIYWWKGKVEKDPELLLVIKTREALLPELTAFVRANHPYDEPEVIGLPVLGGSPSYLQWLLSSATGPGAAAAQGEESK